MKNQRWIAVAIGALCGLVIYFTIYNLLFPKPLPVLYGKSHIAGKEEREEGEEKEAEHDGMQKAMEQEFYMTRDPRLNRIPVERLETARKQAERMKIGAGTRDASVTGLGWQERGPNNIGGRVRAILIDGTDASSNTAIVASVSGGVWRTTNFKAATPAWAPINDFLNNLAVCTLVQDPRPGFQNIMYAGTGEGYYNGDYIRGLGIYKSTDNGLSWTLLSSTQPASSADFQYVQKLLVDDRGNVYAACRSIYCNRGGVQKSVNGGTSWARVLGVDGGAAGCSASLDMEGVDIEMASNKDMYATVGINGPGKIYKSSFAVNGMATGDTAKWTNITPSGSYNRIEIAVAPSDPNRIYALFKGAFSNDVTDIRRSDNAGSTWSALPVPTVYNQAANSVFTNGQGWYDLTLAVDPTHPDTLIIGGLDLLRSYNAGVNWTQISNWTGAGGVFTNNQLVHADQHIIVFDPNNNANAIFGNDGGVFYSSNINASGLPLFTAKNTGLNVTQYYAADLHPTTTNYIIGGAQDNGSHLFTSAGMNAAVTLGGGDGSFCHIDQTDGKIQVISYVFNNYAFSVDGGTNFYGFFQFTSNYCRFINPTDYDDAAKVLYTCDSMGKYGFVKNINNLPTTAPTYSSVNSSAAFGVRMVSAIRVDPNTPNRVWFGISDDTAKRYPLIVRVDNANTAPAATVFPLPAAVPLGGYVSSIDVENGNASHILVTLSNYGISSVFESTDGGTTWNSLDNNGVNLPDMPIRWGMFIPAGYNPGQRTQAIGGILLATELGVWSSSLSNGTSTAWSANNTGLANVRVDMLKMRSSDKMVVAASHGRGIFTTSLVAGALPVTFRSFSGTEEPRYNRLIWQVENEQNNKGFELERKYTGESRFTTVGFIAGKNTNGRNNYSFNDMLVDLGRENAEYRLKQLDENGRSHYSPTVILTRKSASRFIEYISASNNDLFLRVNNAGNQQLTLQFLDTRGSLLRRQQIFNCTQHIDIGWLASGIYIVNIVNSKGERFTQKIRK